MFVSYVEKMNIKNFKKTEDDYEKIKKDFQKRDNYLVAMEIAGEMKEHSETIARIFSFLIEAFNGELRNDNKTPAVFHSIYLTRLLYSCGESEVDTLITSSLHDVLEDTKVSECGLKEKSFLFGKEYIINYLKILKENKDISREPDGKTLPPRYNEHIKRIIGAPKEVINVEIVDRFSDLMDLEYILCLAKEEKKIRLNSKIIKTRSFIENITRNRNDINKNCLNLFNRKVKEIEKLYNINVKIPVLS